MTNTPETLGVDPSALSSLGQALLASAGDIPQAPPPFHTSGTDAISLKIMSTLPSLESELQTGLATVKAEAEHTSNGVINAASAYLQTDEQLAKKYEDQMNGQVDSSSSSGSSGSATSGTDAAATSTQGQSASAATGSEGSSSSGSTSGMSEMGQLMGIAGQAAQLPMQAVGMVAAVPAGIMQGVSQAMQQVSQLAGGMGGGDDAKSATEQQEQQRERLEAERVEQQRHEEGRHQPGAAPATPQGERAPVEPAAPQGDSTPAGPPIGELQPAQTRPAEIASRMNL